MTKLPIHNDTEHTRVDSSRTYKEAKTAETLLNILEGRITNANTRSAYKTAWRAFFSFCSECP
jgi:hypothetical protein